MAEMTAFDVIRLCVHEDGDIELEKLPRYNKKLPNSNLGDLFYFIREITKGRLDAELQSYGVAKDEAYARIHEVITSNYGTVVKVK